MLNQYDNWENVKPAETPMFVPSDEIEVNLLKVIEFEAKHMKRSELEDEATYGALLLQIKARDRFLSDGSTPNIRTFENYGVDVSDPLTGKPFVLRMENGIPRIYGERKNRRSLQPEEIESC